MWVLSHIGYYTNSNIIMISNRKYFEKYGLIYGVRLKHLWDCEVVEFSDFAKATEWVNTKEVGFRGLFTRNGIKQFENRITSRKKEE